MLNNADFWINKLELKPHPEGGFYKEVYRSPEQIKKEGLPERYKEDRSIFTTIYFLLKSNEVSKFHKLKSDEVWYYHAGSAIKILLLDEKGNISEQKLGLNLIKGEVPQIFIPHQTYFAAKILENDSYSLVSCSVSPGFDFDDFDMPEQNELINQFPEHEEIIKKLT